MSRKNCKIDLKVVAQIDKDSKKVREMEQKIVELQNKIKAIQDKNDWIRYSSYDLEVLDDNDDIYLQECIENFYTNASIIQYANKTNYKGYQMT